MGLAHLCVVFGRTTFYDEPTSAAELDAMPSPGTGVELESDRK